MAAPVRNDSLGSRAGRAIARTGITLLVLGLAGAVVFLLSELNAHTFSLGVSDGSLIVLKGRMFPIGSEPYQPADPVQADAYAPLPLEGGLPSGLVGQRFHEREGLNRALFQVIETQARPKIASDDPKQLQSGVALLRRAEKLSGLSEEQRLSLQTMKSEVAYYQARGKLEDAQRLVTESIAQLKSAAQEQNRHARQAGQMVLAIEAPAKKLEDALRLAVSGIGADTALPKVEEERVPAAAPVPATPEAKPAPAGDAP